MTNLKRAAGTIADDGGEDQVIFMKANRLEPLALALLAYAKGMP